MRRRTQTTRTNHHILGYGVGSSRKILDGALARVATAECLQANKTNAFTRFALTLFRLLCFCFGTVKAALKAAAAVITTRPADRGGAPPAFQLQVKVDGATVMLDASSAWTDSPGAEPEAGGEEQEEVEMVLASWLCACALCVPHLP